MRVSELEREQLPALLQLVNSHLSTVVPGWALTTEFLERNLERDSTEPVTDPWVVERATLCVVDGERVLAASHLVLYGDAEKVGEAFWGVGEICWLLFEPGHPDAAEAVLAASQDWLTEKEVKREELWGGGMFVPAFAGVPDTWPHVASTLEAAGYRPGSERREALYGGRLNQAPEPGEPPFANLVVRRSVGAFGPRFSAVLNGEELAYCECVPDLALSGALPALRGWAELAEIKVCESWRNRRIGSWLLSHVTRWLRLAACDRVVLSVAADDERAGAGRLYRRFGWDVFVREVRSWSRE
ncbi:MAG: GNAT family N-acetyltransferase [Rubrobacteraceae bacterium]